MRSPADSQWLARFEREAKILARLSHPNIAAIHGLEEAEDKRFLVLELVEGETLREHLTKGALVLEEALDVCRQIAGGMEAAHEEGVVHRDLKPANVMITPAGQVKVLDFGLAKALEARRSVFGSPTRAEDLTVEGVILGTPAYMSPEQIRGKPTDKRTDIWAFGCVLYEALTGKQQFSGETVSDSMDSGESRLLLNERPTVAYAPPGYLLFGSGETLMAKPFEVAQLEVTGEAFLISEDVGRWDFWSYFSVSQNGVLVYRSASGRSRLVWTNRAGQRLGSPGEPGQYYQIALSQDKELLVVDVGDDELWLLELATGVLSRFTFHPGSDADAVWSPDGRQVLFASDRNGTSDLFQKALGRGDEKPLLESEDSLFPEDWSPAGRFVIFISLQGKAVYQLGLLQEAREPKLLL